MQSLNLWPSTTRSRYPITHPAALALLNGLPWLLLTHSGKAKQRGGKSQCRSAAALQRDSTNPDPHKTQEDTPRGPADTSLQFTPLHFSLNRPHQATAGHVTWLQPSPRPSSIQSPDRYPIYYASHPPAFPYYVSRSLLTAHLLLPEDQKILSFHSGNYD